MDWVKAIEYYSRISAFIGPYRPGKTPPKSRGDFVDENTQGLWPKHELTKRLMGAGIAVRKGDEFDSNQTKQMLAA